MLSPTTRSTLFPYTTLFRSFEPVEKLYRETAPTAVLEIGCWDGGTLQVWLAGCGPYARVVAVDPEHRNRSEEHTSEPSHMSTSYAVICLKKKKTDPTSRAPR